MAFKQVDRVIHGVQKIADNSTTQYHPLGTIVQAFDSTYLTGEFMYLQGVASTAVGSWVSIVMDGGTTVLLAANATGPVGIAMSACVANEYGWYQIRGTGVGKALASYADNADVYITATGGSVDDAVVAGDRVHNAKGASAVGTPSSGLAEFELMYPHTDNIAD
jgi:hypothetical protein